MSIASAQKHLILGTAGHIDHGKTTLVKALTGVDCDRLAEEKRRGITIDLGFASLDLGDLRLGIVDVPGHARFIRNMVAGAAGIDLVMLVVAADDGVMPQTLEHLHICELLGLKRGLVALTKSDLVDDDMLELAVEDVRGALNGTFLEHSPIISVSSTRGAGLPELEAAIRALAAESQPRRTDGPFRLAVDRAFTIRGAGTVVTGTALSGRVEQGAELEILPGGERVRVRGVQVHGKDVAAAEAGERTALNLTGVAKQELWRGAVLADPGALTPTQALDCKLRLLLGSFRLRSGTAAELHIATSEVPAKVRLLDATRLGGGEEGLVQLQLDTAIACAPDDHFILRSSDGTQTIGGGVVLDPHPPKHVRRRIAAAVQRGARVRGAPAARLLHEAAKEPYGLWTDEAQRRLGWTAPELREAVSAAEATGGHSSVEGKRKYFTAPANRERMVAAAMQRLEAYHSAHSLSRRGLSAAELAAGLTRDSVVPAAAVQAALDELVTKGKLIKQLDTFALPGRAFKLTAKDNQALKVLLTKTRATLRPSQPDELLPEVPVDKRRLGQLVAMLIEDGELLSTPGAVYFDPAPVEAARRKLTAHLRSAGPTASLTVSDFNALLGISRKYGLPLLHLFENEGLLVRDGDLRRLR
jgi:selenocysteine-specific elongation factor